MRQIFPDKWRRTPTNLFANHLRGQLLKLSHEIRLDSRFLWLHLYSKSILEHNSAPFNYIKSQKYLLTLQINSLTLCGLNPTCNSLCRLGTCEFLAHTKYYPSSPPHKKTKFVSGLAVTKCIVLHKVKPPANFIFCYYYPVVRGLNLFFKTDLSKIKVPRFL